MELVLQKPKEKGLTEINSQEYQWKHVNVPLGGWLKEPFPGEILGLGVASVLLESTDEEC